MKKLNILLFAALVGLVMVGKSEAGSQTPASRRTISVPYTQKGEQANPLYSGADYLRVTGTNETLVSSGPVVVYGVYLTTGALADYGILRDTDTCNGAGTIALDKIQFTTSTVGGSGFGYGGNLPFPIRLNGGATFQLNTVTAGQSATVLYLKQQ